MILKLEQADGSIVIKAVIGNRVLELTRSGSLPADTDYSGFSDEVKNADLIEYTEPE